MAELPATVWKPYNGNAEMGNGGTADILTLSGDNLVTLAGDQLVTLDGTQTELPTTTWTERDGS